MILPDHEIEAYALRGMIYPYLPKNLQPASYDVRLSRDFLVSHEGEIERIDMGDPSTFDDISRLVQSDRFVLHPGEFVLGATMEMVEIPDHLVGRIEGKSSPARLGLVVHNAGYLDPGFNGVITLEIANLRRVPIILRAGALIAQLSFSEMTSAARTPYQGRYQGDATVTTSRYRDDGRMPSESVSSEPS